MSYAPSVTLKRRQQAVREALTALGVDGLVVTSLPNILYLTNFTGSAAIAVIQARRPVAAPAWVENVGLTGLVLGGIAGWGFSDWLVWGEPLFLATVAALLLAALSATELAHWLSARPLIWLGRRSYSLYLWHPPVIAAAAYLLGSAPEVKATGILIAIAILFSFSEWALIDLLPQDHLLDVVLIVIATILGWGIGTSLARVFVNRRST